MYWDRQLWANTADPDQWSGCTLFAIFSCIVYHTQVKHLLLPYTYEPRHDKTNKWVCTQRRLRSTWASAQSDQSSLCTQWVAKDTSFLHADSEDSDQTGRMPSLIWVFAGRTLTLLVLSCRSSYNLVLLPVHCWHDITFRNAYFQLVRKTEEKGAMSHIMRKAIFGGL